MSLPEKGDWLEEVTFAELEESEAKEIIKKYNVAGKEAGYGGDRRFGRRDDRWQSRRNDYRGKNFRERSYHNQRYDPRQQGGWSNQRSGGGNNWYRDRRNPNREWRGSGRDHGSRDHNQVANYNRSRPQGGNRDHGNWSGGNWSNSQGWNQQGFGGGGSGSYSGNQNWSNNQWKYGGGGGSGQQQQGYGSGYSNWNYYGQYGQQNWNSQK